MDTSKTILSILISICLAIAGFSLKWTFDANATSAADRAANIEKFKIVNEKLDHLAEQSAIDESQSSQLSKQWRLHSWARGRINHLEHNAGDRPSDWPELNPTH